jgi:hypothetical protein
MKNLVYVGGDETRELTPSDLEQLGVGDAEATLTFQPGKSLTLHDKVADAILGRVTNVREATAEEMDAEMKQMEVELGFEPYNPNEHSVAEVSEVLAASSEERRRYILDQEHGDRNRKGVFEAVGAEWSPKEETEAEMAQHADAVDAEVVDLTEPADETGDEPDASPSA